MNIKLSKVSPISHPLTHNTLSAVFNMASVGHQTPGTGYTGTGGGGDQVLIITLQLIFVHSYQIRFSS